MTETYENSVLFIIKQITEICGEAPGKKQLQKLVYLIEQKGIDLHYIYGLHFYGPYSSDLDSDTVSYSMDGLIEFNYSSNSHRMKIRDDIQIDSGLSKEQEGLIKEVISRFKDRSPSELELLATAIYAHDNLDNISRDSVINGVKKIKGSKYSKEKIENILNDFAYFDKVLS